MNLIRSSHSLSVKIHPDSPSVDAYQQYTLTPIRQLTVSLSDVGLPQFLSMWRANYDALSHTAPILGDLSYVIQRKPARRHIELMNAYGVEQGTERFLDLLCQCAPSSAVMEFRGFLSHLGSVATVPTPHTPCAYVIGGHSLLDILDHTVADQSLFLLSSAQIGSHAHVLLKQLQATFCVLAFIPDLDSYSIVRTTPTQIIFN